MMEETEILLPQNNRDSVKLLERDLLREDNDGGERKDDGSGKIPMIPILGGYADAVSVLIVYLVVMLGLNGHMAWTVAGPSYNYYVINMIANAIGLLGVLLLNSNIVFIYGTYLVSSFLFSSFIDIASILVVFRSSACQDMGDLVLGKDLTEFCLAGPLRFQIITVTAIISELALQIFILGMTKRLYDWTLKNGASDDESLPRFEKKLVGRKGTITMNE